MALFDFVGKLPIVRRWVDSAAKQELKQVHKWLSETADAQQYDMPDPYVYVNQADMYRVSSTLASALDIVGRDVGLAKINVSRMVGEEEREIKNHPFEKKMRNPNPLQSGMELKRDTIIQRLLNGNAVWWLNRESQFDEPAEIWHVPFNKIQPVPDGRMFLSHYNYFPGGGKPAIPLPTWQIVHFKSYNPFNPFVGLSLVESLAITLYGDLGMRKTQKQVYTKYNGAPPSILAFKDYPANDVWTDIKSEMKKASVRNEMMLLRGAGDGVSWMSRATSSKDAQFVELLRQNMTDIFNRVAPGLLAALDSEAKYSNAQAGGDRYKDMTLYPYLMELSEKMTAEIMPAYGRNLVAEFDDPRVKDKALEIRDIYAYSLFHTIDEVRQEKYKGEPIGDERGSLLRTEINAPTVGDSEDGEFGETDDGEEKPQDENSAKAAITDLLLWRKLAKKGKPSAKTFVSDNIPSLMMREIAAKMRITDDTEQVTAFIDRKIDSFKPKPQASAYDLIQGMDKVLRGMEK